MPLTLRKATLKDSALLFLWRNDPDTVQASTTGRPVSEAEHDRWMVKVLSDQTWHLYIACATIAVSYGKAAGGILQTVGMGRLQEVAPAQAVVSYSVGPEYRGDGYGGEIVAGLCAQALLLGYTSLRAEARLSNAASIRTLLAAGFAFSAVEFLTLEREL